METGYDAGALFALLDGPVKGFQDCRRRAFARAEEGDLVEVQETRIAEGFKLLPVHYFCFPVAFAFAGKRFLCASIQAVVQSREMQLSGKQLPRLCASFRRNRTIYSS